MEELYDTYEKYNGKYHYIGKCYIEKDNIEKTRQKIIYGRKHLYITYKKDDVISEIKYII